MNKNILAAALVAILVIVGITIWMSESKKDVLLSETPAQTVSVTGANFVFAPAEIRAKKGELMKIVFTNTGTYPHNLIIGELNVYTAQVNPGETTEVAFVPDRTGEFEYYCGIGNHREKGMVGKLIVE